MSAARHSYQENMEGMDAMLLYVSVSVCRYSRYSPMAALDPDFSEVTCQT